ncbi:hypothetical protein M5M_10395 [Simiduia agarivorans SA1 = DSM 21679]|uniref:Uncharacterized protein n=2 Tax=Simiduia TaxID=447467 RepID=K4KM14_SIMAS|nr:hypothetical protein M5M_10395 [Simiduia agarivorans SA1 = DSM 21679]
MRTPLCLFLSFAISSFALAQPSDGDKGKRKPPEEAITACADASEGSQVSFTLANGDTINGTCVNHRGQLLAIPDEHLARMKREKTGE